MENGRFDSLETAVPRETISPHPTTAAAAAATTNT